MGSIETHLFNQSLEQITERMKSSNEEQQHRVLIQLDAIAKKQEPIAIHRPQEEVLTDIKQAMKCDRARVFFGYSFPSWYRNGSIEQVSQLHHWANLDMSNRHLFLEMLSLRDLGHFDDERLYQFEQFCLEAVGESMSSVDRKDSHYIAPVPKEALILLEHLMDRLVEAADCMEAGIESTRAAGLTTADLERQIQDSRFFSNEAKNYLKAMKGDE